MGLTRSDLYIIIIIIIIRPFYAIYTINSSTKPLLFYFLIQLNNVRTWKEHFTSHDMKHFTWLTNTLTLTLVLSLVFFDAVTILW